MNLVNILASTNRALVALAGLALVFNAGCAVLNNGTGETITFEMEDMETRLFDVDPCDFREVVFTRSSGSVSKVLDANGDALWEVFTAIEIPDGQRNVIFDGAEIYFSDTAPDLSQKVTLTLRNESNESVYIRPCVPVGTSPRIQIPPSTLIPPQGTLDFTTIRTGQLRFDIFKTTIIFSHGHCTIELADGNEVIWDGTKLRCVENPGGTTALIDICNTDTQTNAPSVIFVLQGQDPLVDGVFVIANQCEVLEVPSGAPATISVFDNEGVLERGACTINDPTNGDSATWDGTEVTCVDQ